MPQLLFPDLWYLVRKLKLKLHLHTRRKGGERRAKFRHDIEGKAKATAVKFFFYLLVRFQKAFIFALPLTERDFLTT